MSKFSRLSFVIFVCLLVPLSTDAATNVEMAEDRMAVVNGERTFILGLYENPEDDAVLRDAADAGFNLVRSRAEADALDRLHAHGLGAWLMTGNAIDLSSDTEARAAQLEQMVDAFAKHPALLVWEVPDEALWNVWHEVVLWRWRDEPRQQRERIQAIDDAQVRAALQAQLDEVAALRSEGRYTESEALADALWGRLGETPPRKGWGITDAHERQAKLLRGMRAGYAHLRALDPAHPVWMNHAPRNQISQLAAFNEAADITGCDIYPVPEGNGHSDLKDQTLSSTGAYTQRMQEAAPGKPVWMVLQGFSWRDLNPDRGSEQEFPRPSPEQTRFMAHNAIVHGARGILYWGTHYVEKDSEFWRDLLAVIKELDALQPVLSARDANAQPGVEHTETLGSIDKGVVALAKDAPDGTWLLVVNEFKDPLHYTLTGLDGYGHTRYRMHGAEERVEVRNGTLSLHIAPYTVQVLAPE